MMDKYLPVFPSIENSTNAPFAEMQPQTFKESPPCFTVAGRHSLFKEQTARFLGQQLHRHGHALLCVFLFLPHLNQAPFSSPTA